ncbi:hypothetical protein TELCIR_20359, partial [Teladorsagia circumcincta]
SDETVQRTIATLEIIRKDWQWTLIIRVFVVETSNSRLHKYRFDYRTDMSVDLMAELLARNLYYRRFFPYYTGAILAGIDENGKGAVFSYDPIGCVERIAYSASGAAEPMMIPFLDCQ